MNQKHYLDIERLVPRFVPGFRPGDRIVIQEKIDGANFSIRYDEENGTLRCYSRKTELDLSNNLRGAWNWVQTLDTERVASVLGNHLILFAEWLVPHTVTYPQDAYKKAYFYDVYDTEAAAWLEQNAVKEIVQSLDLIYVPVFYDGPFTNWDDVKHFVGHTQLGGDLGEGVVVKNQTRLNSDDMRIPFYTKIVAEKFCETKEHKCRRKEVSPEELEDREMCQKLTESIVTEARVRKLLNKFVDEGIIPDDWGAKDMGTIAKNIGRRVYEDCIKEEKETVEQIGEKFGKYAASTAMFITKTMLKERESV